MEGKYGISYTSPETPFLDNCFNLLTKAERFHSDLQSMIYTHFPISIL